MDFTKMKVTQLKAALKATGLPTTGSKAKMIERLEKHVQGPVKAGEDIPEKDEEAGRGAEEEFLTQQTEEEPSPSKVRDTKRGDRVDPVTEAEVPEAEVTEAEVPEAEVTEPEVPEAEVCAVILRRQEERLGRGRRTSLRRTVFNQRIRDRVTRSCGRGNAD